MSDKRTSQEICTMLYWELCQKSLTTDEITTLVKDTLQILCQGGKFTLPGINKTLNNAGWERDIITTKAMELLCEIIQNEFNYKVKAHHVA
ncbi:MAG: hypothetical protein GY714_27990 [Desulfobacterales bacterium]|nr:hypothetical protein [Desulfobacterales bacterium]MCP4159341.1 hypothetical protein [Deltaproteobacteria bacterium]